MGSCLACRNRDLPNKPVVGIELPPRVSGSPSASHEGLSQREKQGEAAGHKEQDGQGKDDAMMEEAGRYISEELERNIF